MDICFDCTISLSKKMRSIIGRGDAKLVLVCDTIVDGKGNATIMLSGEDINLYSAKQTIGNETSIQFTTTAVKDEVPTASVVSNIFSTSHDPSHQGETRTAVDMLAVTSVPDKSQRSQAVVRQDEMRVPEAFAELQDDSCNRYISDFNELMMAMKAAQGKESEINLDAIDDPVKKALAFEMKEKAEAIDIPAFIVNDTCGSIRLNDIDLTLALNSPINLTNISAKRLAESGDLRSMLRSNHIKFIDPKDVDSYVDQVKDAEQPCLDVYDLDGALDAMGSGGSSSGASHYHDAAPVDLGSGAEQSEQEQLAGLINLSGSNSLAGSSAGVHTSHHGGGRTIGNTSKENAQGLKSIRKL